MDYQIFKGSFQLSHLFPQGGDSSFEEQSEQDMVSTFAFDVQMTKYIHETIIRKLITEMNNSGLHASI